MVKRTALHINVLEAKTDGQTQPGSLFAETEQGQTGADCDQSGDQTVA